MKMKFKQQHIEVSVNSALGLKVDDAIAEWFYVLRLQAATFPQPI